MSPFLEIFLSPVLCVPVCLSPLLLCARAGSAVLSEAPVWDSPLFVGHLLPPSHCSPGCFHKYLNSSFDTVLTRRCQATQRLRQSRTSGALEAAHQLATIPVGRPVAVVAMSDVCGCVQLPFICFALMKPRVSKKTLYDSLPRIHFHFEPKGSSSYLS